MPHATHSDRRPHGCPDGPARFCRAAALRRLATATLTAAALAAPAHAQVNTEKMRVGADEPGWGGALDLSAALQRGNRERDILGAGFRLQYAWPPEDTAGEEASAAAGKRPQTVRVAAAFHQGVAVPDDATQGPANVVFLTSNYSFTRLNGSRYINNALTHVRFIRRHGARTFFEVFGQHQFNEFTRLERRLLLGGGGRFALLRAERSEIFLGAGYMLERETLDLAADLPDARRSEHHRSTNYLTVRYNSEDDRLRLVQTLYAQPRLDRPEDFRLLSETSFEIQIVRRLALTINLNVAHDSEPPTGVEETDTVLSNSLRYSF